MSNVNVNVDINLDVNVDVDVDVNVNGNDIHTYMRLLRNPISGCYIRIYILAL